MKNLKYVLLQKPAKTLQLTQEFKYLVGNTNKPGWYGWQNPESRIFQNHKAVNNYRPNLQNLPY